MARYLLSARSVEKGISLGGIRFLCALCESFATFAVKSFRSEARSLLRRLHILRDLRGKSRMPFLSMRSSAVRWPELSCAEMPALLDIKIFRQRWQRGNGSTQLLAAFENNFRPIGIFFYIAANLDHLARKLAYVTDTFQIVREHHYRESAQPVVITEIQIMFAVRAHCNSNHLAGYALHFSDMLLRFIKRNASARDGRG